MDKQANLSLTAYNTLRADAAQKLRTADRLGVHIAANLIRAALPTAVTLHLHESDQSIDFEWDFGYLLNANSERIAYIDIDSITLANGTVIPLEDGLSVWSVIRELPEHIPTVAEGAADVPAPEYTSWFHPNGSTAHINLAAAASDDA